jgi:hypothetical protein
MFATSPALSIDPHALGLVIPPPILNADLTNPAVLRTRKRQGRDYTRQVKAARIGDDAVTINDCNNAEDYEFNANLAGRLNDIAPLVGDFNQAAILAAIAAIAADTAAITAAITGITAAITGNTAAITGNTAAITGILARLDNMSNLMFNSSAHNDEDNITPPPGHGNPPNYLPRTILQLRNLTQARVQGLENYFQLPEVPNITLPARKNRIRRHYNVAF